MLRKIGGIALLGLSVLSLLFARDCLTDQSTLIQIIRSLT